MIKLSHDSKVYVMCPAGVATGGPELLHQLAFTLRANNIDAQMYYIPIEEENPVHKAYEQYNVPYVKNIQDEKQNVLVTCEIYKHVKIASSFKQIRKCLWWLSVDNFFLSRPLDGFIYRIYSKVAWAVDSVFYKYFKRSYFDLPAYVMSKYKNFKISDDMLLNGFDFHLYQSEYARQTLIKIGVKEDAIYPLSDYLNMKFLKENDLNNENGKENIVLYYPRKGKKFTTKLIKIAPKSITFVPIIGLTREQMVALLKRAKVYIDFGHFPGKDRVPREAAICGCCVITGRRGAAGNSVDFPINEKYKFLEDEEEAIINRIDDCFRNYNTSRLDFDQYRSIILGEYDQFVKQVNELFLN